MYSTFRVINPFGWQGWQYLPHPQGPCECTCSSDISHCTGLPYSQCPCAWRWRERCYCPCTREDPFVADAIWMVEERHPHIGAMLWANLVVYDSGIGLYPDRRTVRHMMPYTEPKRGINVVRQPLYPLR